MPISFSSLFQDSINFIRNHFAFIFPILIGLTVLGQLIDWLLGPSLTALEPIQRVMEKATHMTGNTSLQAVQNALQSLPPQEQQLVAKMSFVYLAQFLVSKLMQIHLILIFSLALIWQLATFPRIDFSALFAKAGSLIWPVFCFLLFSIPYFIVLILMSALLTPLLFFILTLGSLLYFVIYDLFLVFMVNNRGAPVLAGIRFAFTFLKKQYSMILPIIALWIGVEMTLNFLVFPLSVNYIWVEVIFNILNLFIYFFLFTYLFRLYILTKENRYGR